MAININEVGWGSYGQYEGPLTFGKRKVKKIEDITFGNKPDELDKYVYVVCQTEGAAFDAVNFYDRCICTVGLIQFCDVHPNYFVANMLGDVAKECGLDFVVNTLKPALDLVNAGFGKNTTGKYRFHIYDNGSKIEVNSAFLQNKLYFGGSTGLKGQWAAEQKKIAKIWVSCLTAIWDNEKARKVQIKYTKDKIMTFAFGDGKKALWSSEPTSDTGKALRAVYISYAANLPAVASRIVASTAVNSKFAKWSDEWCKEIAYALVFTSNVNIWPERYNKIMPAVKEQFGGNLPLTKEELFNWKAGKDNQKEDENINIEVVFEEEEELIVAEKETVEEIKENKIVSDITVHPSKEKRNFFFELLLGVIKFIIEVMSKFKK